MKHIVPNRYPDANWTMMALAASTAFPCAAFKVNVDAVRRELAVLIQNPVNACILNQHNLSLLTLDVASRECVL